ncbi:MAG: O-antigen ligase family protein, partial [Acidimicrobiales bacterium]
SVLWSVNPEPTLWRGVVYMALPLAAWVLADLSHERFLRAASIAFGLLLTASVALVAMWSSTGLDRNDDWRGIFTNRNSFAPVCAVAILVGVAEMTRRKRGAGAVLVAIATIALLGTGSRTAWIALLVALGGATLLVGTRRLMFRRQGPAVPVTGALMAVLGGLVVFAAIASLWNESTFVQRRTIWDLVGDHIADRPLHGSGFQAFWTVPELIGRHELLGRGSAHGSVPETLLGLGAIGLALWATVVLAAVIGTVRWVWRDPGAMSWFWLALTTFLVVENATESFVSWFSYNWVLLMAAALRAWYVRLPTPAGRSAPATARAIS